MQFNQKLKFYYVVVYINCINILHEYVCNVIILNKYNYFLKFAKLIDL